MIADADCDGRFMYSVMISDDSEALQCKDVPLSHFKGKTY